MHCPSCERDIFPGSKFCRHCGARLTSPWLRLRARLRGFHWPWKKTVLASVAVVLVLGVVFTGYQTVRAISQMPRLGDLVNVATAGQDSVVYDRYNKPVAYLHLNINRIDVPLSAISPNMRKAVVAIEDHNFWHQNGLDIRAIGRAAIHDLLHTGGLEGASTISEQLAKMLYLRDNRTLSYKIQEFMLGLELAHRYSKAHILDMYLNEVYLGNGAYGIDAAARAYFDESPDQLTLAQASMLAGLPQAPSLYDPLTHYRLARARQKLVLQAMVKYGDVTAAQARAAYRAPLHFNPQNINAPKGSTPYPYPWYIQHVIHQLETEGLSPQEVYDGGLKIYTNLDPTIYAIAQQAVDQWMNKNFGANPAFQAAVTVEDPHSGAVWAVIGGRSYQGNGPEDLATNPNVQRSSGSSIKPLMDYTEAIVKGYSEMSVIQDVPIFQHVNGEAWWPQNDDHVYRGYITLRDALAISDNDAAVHLLRRVGVQYGFNFATKKFGLPLPRADAQQIGIAIGGFAKGGVNVSEMTRAYSAFPNQGTLMKPIWVRQVVNGQGRVIKSARPHGRHIFSAAVAFIMNNMLSRVLTPTALPGIGPNAYATGVHLGIGRPAAGKTGTSNGERDAWFIGYEPQMVVGVWEGNAAHDIPQPSTPNGPAYGAVAAGPIWQQIMEQVNQAEHLPPKPFPKPHNVIYLPHISITSGKLASPHTPSQDIEGGWFIKGTQPTTTGHTHEVVRVPAFDPHVLWEPGCGPAINAIFLKPEPDWHKGVPMPWDSIYWPPTEPCTTVVPSGPSGPPSPPGPPGFGGPPGKQPKHGHHH
ncbi:transglycosylase domain-containing protein [Sulfobacillus harzensis]|uniref:Penicillin-binding protein 1A n=1 Tax=Sulfobacillus harzensis TaxID=2729629 RepID=A0A7Y0Q424_9FIRM|nr:transglycosylase domain-containing protein [Sulfobacillus harzensis]NMP23960.1 peptidoglycan glycosyltransferase [Sulfobacillus harzensis]